MTRPRWLLTASPHLSAPDSTPRIMWSVVWSLAPVMVAAIYYFGPSALLVVFAASAGALATERIFGRSGTLGDGLEQLAVLLESV